MALKSLESSLWRMLPPGDGFYPHCLLHLDFFSSSTTWDHSQFFLRLHSLDMHVTYSCGRNPARVFPLCDYCGKKFCQPQHLRSHQKRMHAGKATLAHINLFNNNSNLILDYRKKWLIYYPLHSSSWYYELLWNSNHIIFTRFFIKEYSFT